jgi:cell wall-associated NlpC family hydrolase
LQRSFGSPGWCALCRWTAVGAISVGTMAVLGAATSDHRPAPTVVRLAAQPEGSGLDWAGWTVRDPAEQRRSLDLLLTREKDRRAARARAGVTSVTTTRPPASPPSSVAVPPSALGRGTTLAAPQAVSVAITYALAQVGKPYVWGATGPDSYDCSGLVQRSYAMAGVALPRTSREQARVGTAVDLPELLPGDLLFWAYDPSDLSTVHHVAMYLGDGKIVQAPQPGEFVEVTTLWLGGYAGAVRVATGPATATLPPVPVGVPGSGVTPIGDAMPDGSPPPSVAPTADTPPRSHAQSASSQNDAAPGSGGTTPGTGSAGTTSPGTTSPGTTSPGTTSPGTTSPGGTSSGTTSPGGTSSDVTSPGTTSPSSSAGDGSSPSGSHVPSGTSSGTTPPSTSSAASTTTSAPTSSAPTSSAPTSSAPTSSAPTSSAPTTTPPSTTSPPAPSPSGDASSDSAAPATTTSAPTSTTPANPTPTPS